MVVTVDAIQHAYQGVDIAEQIREFIKDAHRLWGTEFVLLGGGANIVPVRWIPSMPTDLYYSAICHQTLFYNDNWNGNGNNIFGENGTTENCDFVPDIAVGRAPVSGEDDVDLFLLKNFTYARCSRAVSIPDGAWLNKQLNIQGITFEEDWSDELNGLKHSFNIIQDHHQDSEILGMFEYYEDWETIHPDWCPAYYPTYPEGCTTNGVPIHDEDVIHSNVINQINQRYGLINHFDHSGPSNLGLSIVTRSSTNLTSTDIQNLSPTNKYPLMISGGCHTTAIERNKYIGEQWLNADNGGVSFLGATVDIGGHASYKFNSEVYNTIYSSAFENIGFINNFTSSNSSSFETYLYKIMNLLGDPELSVYTNEPIDMSVSYANTISIGNSDYDVNVTGFPLGETVKACLFKEDEVYEVIESTTGNITFNITPDTPGEMKLTITCQNAEPFESTINVIQNSGTHLYLSNRSILDANGNGYIEPGETFQLLVELSNSGAIGATSISGVLSTSDLNSVITQNSSNYPAIPSLQTGNSITNYVITASITDLYQGQSLPLTLTINSAQGIFVENFFISIKGPEPDLVQTKLETSINNDNIIDPGDVVSATLTLHNSGIGPAIGLVGVISTTDPMVVSINSATQSFGNILPLCSQTNAYPFVFTVSQFYAGEHIQLNLALTNIFGQQWDIPITIEYPNMINGLDFVGYSTSISLSWIPQQNVSGYNVYRCNTADGNFIKLNDRLIENYSGYVDNNLQSTTFYYYKVAAINHSGLLGPMCAPLTAWTTLPYHADWPVTEIDVDIFGDRSEGGPVASDINGDGNEEIFFNTSDLNGKYGGIFGFLEDKQELYDIDNDPSTLSGFYLYDNAGSNCLPSMGDINKDGIQEIITTTKSGDIITDKRKVIVHSTSDSNADGKPDLLWSQDIGGPGSRGACLSDLNNDGDLEILVKSDYCSPFQVFSCDGTYYPGWPVNFGKDGFTMPAACDLDNDGFKEVIFGCKDGIYIYNHDGTPFLTTSNDGLFFNHINGAIADHMDSAPVFIDMNNDGYYEMIWVSGRASAPGKGRVFALDRYGNFVQNWGYDDHIFNITYLGSGILWLPNPSVGRIDYNGNKQIIVTIAEQSQIYCWGQDGNALQNFPITVAGLRSKFISPLIADIDDDDDLEIIVSSNSSNGGIYAFNFDGSPVVGWPLRVKSFSTPHISDIDNDGKNEVISTAAMECHVWKTEGDADKVEWGSFRNDTYNSGIYDNICRSDDEPVSIESNTIWDSDRKLHGNIHVEMGATFTIKSKVEMPANSKIIIKRGGKLVLDGGVITSNESCSSQWRGIDVWGNSNLAQIPTSNQGHIQIINGGTIENAECGIRTWKPDALPDGSESLDPDKDYFGGIVWANGAVFKNNKTAVEFMPYEFRNYSYLTQCSFETTSALPNGALPDYFVKLDGVTAVSITGNDFNNTYTGYTNINERGGGIYAFDSDVLVDKICTGQVMPCNEYKKSTFSGLYRGIYAFGASRQRTVRIQGSDISNTVRGIYLSSLDFAEVNLNNFQVWDEVVGLNPQGYSVYIDAGTGFTIEENQFTNPGSSRKGIGLIINESGADNNQVYNNYFANLNFATIAQGYNRSGGSTTTGLCYKCNDFVNNDNDIRIARRNSNVLAQQDGIKYYQGANIPGDHLAPAGNTFTTVTNSKDISNSCNWIVYYRHHIGPASLLPSPADLTTNYQVFGTTYTKSVSCPSHLGTGTEKEEVKAALESATAEAEATQVALISLVDGGSTPELQTEVITSIPEEGMELRDQLLTESPYLSDTVLKTSITKEDVLNNAMIRDVMVANPQSAKSAQMVEMLDERVNPMTDEMKNEILSGQTITSEKEDLEATLSFMKQEAWYNFGALCRLYAVDTLHTWSSDTIGVLFANETSLESQYKLVFWHLFKGNASSATQVISSIPATFTLDASEAAQHERYTLLLNTLIQLSNNPEVLLEAGTDVANTLTQLNTMSEDKPAAMSRNLLIAAGLMSYDEPIKLDDVLKTMPVYNPTVKAKESAKLRVYPNPANDFITIAWNTPDHSNLLLTLTDANGRTVHQQRLNGQNNEAILNISEFVNGSYRLSLSEGKKTIASETVVIQK